MGTKDRVGAFHDGEGGMGEQVSTPRHYVAGGIEAIEVIDSKLTTEEYIGYCKGNILKYLMRANYKGHHDIDCRKAAWYAEELVNALEIRETDSKESGE